MGQIYIIKRINTGHHPSTSQLQPHGPLLSSPFSTPLPQVRYLALNSADSAVITSCRAALGLSGEKEHRAHRSAEDENPFTRAVKLVHDSCQDFLKKKVNSN